MKTLSDPRENLVNFKPHDSSIGRLRKKPHPHVGAKNVTGVGFFDIPHGQTGIAPNAIELHPVLKFLPSSCSH